MKKEKTKGTKQIKKEKSKEGKKRKFTLLIKQTITKTV